MTRSTVPFPSWKRALWAAACTVLLTAVLNLLAAHRLRAYRALSHDSEQVVEQLTSLRGHLLNAETGQRGYLLVGEQPYLAPYRNAVGLVSVDIDTLTSFAKSGRVDEGAISRLAVFARMKVRELDTTIVLHNSGHGDDAMALVRSDSGRRLMDSARKLIVELRDREMAQLDDRRAIEERWANIVLLIVLSGAALTIGSLVYLNGALSRYDADQRAATRELEKQMLELEALARARHQAGSGAPLA